MNKKESQLGNKIYSDLAFYNNKSEQNSLNKPLIFQKKQNNNIRVIPLRTIISDTGLLRHHTPAAQE
jgi:hypothetical protein